MNSTPTSRGAAEVFTVFLRLGLTSFGGPLAHLGYFHREFVVRRQWLTERAYADLVALCQFLPGPASSQVGMAIGLLRRGYLGAIAAWAGFTLPSALMLIALGVSTNRFAGTIPTGVVHGLSVMAIAVVAHAVWSMASRLCRGIPLISVALVAMMLAWANPSTAGQIGVLLLAGFAGMLTVRPTPAAVHERLELPLSRREGAGWLCALVLVFVGLMAADTLGGSATTSVFLAFFRTGSVVFGGGHVVLPVLHAAVVSKGWINENVFVAGYSAAQAIPGPLFTFAGFLGAAMHAPVSGWSGGSLCVAAIFAPSFMLVFGALPYWEGLRQCRRAQAALAAVNAATVGILAATFQRALVATSLHSLMDITLAAAALTAIVLGRLPLWTIALSCAALGHAAEALR